MSALWPTFSAPWQASGRKARHERGRLPAPLRASVVTRVDVGDTSRKASGWNPERKEKARKVAQQSRFFERAHPTPHREPAPFLKTQFIQNLGSHAAGFDEAFEDKVLTLFHEELTDAAIARVLNVERSTVAKRTMRWRSPKSKRERKVTTGVAERRGKTANALSLEPKPQPATTADETID